MTATIRLTAKDFAGLRSHLLPAHSDTEHAAFAFAEPQSADGAIVFDVKEWTAIAASGFEFQSGYHIELTDEARASIIKRAWDLGLSIVEFHTHLGTRRGTSFSPSDLSGLEDFVPHVWWRLRGKPYAAVVMGTRDFDALAWSRDARVPEAVTAVVAGGRVLKPTGITIASLARKGDT